MTIPLRPSSSERAFTMIEMMVTIAIISILAAIAVPTFVNHRATATDNATRNVAAIGGTLATSLRGPDKTAAVPEARLRTEFKATMGVEWMMIPESVDGFCMGFYHPDGKTWNSPDHFITYDSENGGAGFDGGACPEGLQTLPE